MGKQIQDCFNEGSLSNWINRGSKIIHEKREWYEQGYKQPKEISNAGYVNQKNEGETHIVSECFMLAQRNTIQHNLG